MLHKDIKLSELPNKMLQNFKKHFYLASMTLHEAFIQFTETDNFKDVAKQNNSAGAKYRIYFARFRSGKLKAGAIVELLIANGYEIKANRVTKKKLVE